MKLLSSQLNERKIIKLVQQLDKYATLHKLHHEVKVPTPMVDMKLNNRSEYSCEDSTYNKYFSDPHIDMKSNKQMDQVTPTLQLSNELDLVFDDDVESDSNTLNAYHAYQKIRKQRYKVWSRSSIIRKQFIGMSFEVHNGKSFIPVIISEEIVGHRFGEFAPTRKLTVHKVTK